MTAKPRTKRKLRVLSQSAITAYRRCAREYYFKYILLRRAQRKTEALRFGSLAHVGLNAWWSIDGNGEDRLVRSVIAMRTFAVEQALSEGEVLDIDLAKAEELMVGYTARWGDESWHTVAVEMQFDVPIVNPATGRESQTHRLRGAIDLVAEKGQAGGPCYFFEHKTSTRDISYGSDYWRKISALDAQVSTYWVAAEQSGLEPFECMYDVIRKPGLRLKSATPEESRRYTAKGFLDKRQRDRDETVSEFRARLREELQAGPEKYYARGPIVRLDRDKAEHMSDLWFTTKFIHESESSGRYPRSPNACERFGRLCEYFEVCSGSASIEDDSLFRTADRPHEELQEI